jgi:hypothetical protein
LRELKVKKSQSRTRIILIHIFPSITIVVACCIIKLPLALKDSQKARVAACS